MKHQTINKMIATLAICGIGFISASAIAGPSYAADTDESHHAGTDTQKSYAVKGEVVAIDQGAGKVKLRHEAIPELGWSAMTMNFAVADKGLMGEVKSGDKVSFRIAKDQSTGQYVIRTLQVAQ